MLIRLMRKSSSFKISLTKLPEMSSFKLVNISAILFEKVAYYLVRNFNWLRKLCGALSSFLSSAWNLANRAPRRVSSELQPGIVGLSTSWRIVRSSSESMIQFYELKDSIIWLCVEYRVRGSEMPVAELVSLCQFNNIHCMILINVGLWVSYFPRRSQRVA